MYVSTTRQRKSLYDKLNFGKFLLVTRTNTCELEPYNYCRNFEKLKAHVLFDAVKTENLQRSPVSSLKA
jgi:hypothetical protein